MVERSQASTTTELVWLTTRGTLTITSTHMCRDIDGASDAAAAPGGCVRLSAADLHEVDRFFGAPNFRARWDAYRPCAASSDDENAAFFRVTFADGHTIAKPLERLPDMPASPACDRATRDAVAGIGSDLVRRYFR